MVVPSNDHISETCKVLCSNKYENYWLLHILSNVLAGNSQPDPLLCFGLQRREINVYFQFPELKSRI